VLAFRGVDILCPQAWAAQAARRLRRYASGL
jgi:hypothetical protein